jgi:hypothetical protein
MGKLKLTVNEEKTRICKVPEGEFDFLGYTFGRMYSARTGQARLGWTPATRKASWVRAAANRMKGPRRVAIPVSTESVRVCNGRRLAITRTCLASVISRSA